METNYIQEAKEDFDTKTLPWLQIHGKRIGVEYNNGNSDAKRIVEAYQMLHARFEQCAYGILCAAIENYKNKFNL